MIKYNVRRLPYEQKEELKKLLPTYSKEKWKWIGKVWVLVIEDKHDTKAYMKKLKRFCKPFNSKISKMPWNDIDKQPKED